MAERRTKESNDNTSLRKRQVAAFAGLLVSFMLLLSIISYSTEDQRISDLGLRDLWRAFTNDAAMRETAAKTSNLLGILGALISNWFINSTIGYAIIILPLLGIGWSYVILRNADRRALTIATIYIASYAGLFSIICGVIHAATAGSAFSSEWSGVIGTFLAEGLVTLMGVTGASVALVGIFIVLTVVAIDIDVTELLRKIGEFLSASGLLLKRFWEWIVDTLKRSEEKLLKTKVIQKKTTVEIKRSPDELAEKVGQRKEILKEYPPAVKEVETEPELVKDRTDEGELTPSTKNKLSVAINERKEEEEFD